MLERSPWQQDFAYLPRVSADQRHAFERRQGDVSLREVSGRDTVVAAGLRAEYFPVLFTDPEAGHDALLGIDHLADPPRGQAIDKARTTGRLAASPPIYSVAVCSGSCATRAATMPATPWCFHRARTSPFT